MATKKPKPDLKHEPLEDPPAVPEGLSGAYAIEYWQRITAELVSVRQITALHLESLEAMCNEWETYQKITEWMHQAGLNGWIQTNANTGMQQKHPFIMMRKEAFTNLTNLWEKFGLTATGLGKIQTTKSRLGQTSNSDPAGGLKEFAERKPTD